MVVKKLGNLDTPDRPTVASAAPTRDEARRIAAGGSARSSEPNFGGKKATPASLSGRSNLRIWSSLDARGRSPDVRSSSLSTVRRRSRGSLPRLHLKHTSKRAERCVATNLLTKTRRGALVNFAKLRSYTALI